MTRKLKPVDTNLSPALQAAVRAITVPLEDGSHSTVGELLEQARGIVQLVNTTVQENALVYELAAAMMKQEKRRGTPKVITRLDGTVALRVSYGEGGRTLALAAEPVSTKLPTLPELRVRAKAENVDISDLGRQKLKIMARLNQVEADAVPTSGVGR